MLLELRVQNFGIVEDLRLRPGPGLNVITGETGAGKSLVLAALDIALGARAGMGVIRTGAHRAAVEALFDLGDREHLRDRLAERGIPLNDRYLQIRREILPGGRSRPLLNGEAVPLAFVRGLAPLLMEIHGQHEHQRILDPDSHMDYLDSFADCLVERGQVAELYHRFREIRDRRRAATMEKGERAQRIEFLHFAIEDIDSVDPRPDEFEELQQEKALIENSGRVYLDLCEVYGSLREEEGSVLDRLACAADQLERHTGLMAGLEERVSEIREAQYLLESSADFLRDQKDRLQFSPERLEDIEDRLASYKRLHKKYGGSTASVLAARDAYLSELSSIEMSEEELEKLAGDEERVYELLREKAEFLSRKRRSVAAALEARLAGEIEALGMPGARIRVQIKREVEDLESETDTPDLEETNAREATEKAGGPRYLIYEKGFDRVEFLLNANAGETFQPLRKVASGGELSRITLGLKALFLQQHTCPAVVFDEIDAGVGGEVAYQIGERLRDLAARSQVLVVTHLHQIAGLADEHFQVEKNIRAGRTTTALRHLEGDDRLQEMARMLGGNRPGPVVVEHARRLLADRQEKWPNAG